MKLSLTWETLFFVFLLGGRAGRAPPATPICWLATPPPSELVDEDAELACCCCGMLWAVLAADPPSAIAVDAAMLAADAPKATPPDEAPPT